MDTTGKSTELVQSHNLAQPRDLPSHTSCPYLVFEDANGKREVLLDTGDVWKLGRSSKSTIELEDEAISRNHALIQRSASGEYYFIDLGSQNGSFVNDRRVSTPISLKNGDRVSIGRTLIVFQNPNQPSGNGPPSTTEFAVTQHIFAQRRVTVLVVDIREYTVLTNRIAQSVLCQMIGKWFSDAGRIMQQYGSSVQKYIGDSVMSLWIHENIQRDRRVVVQILRALAEFEGTTSRLSERFELPQKVRIGAGLNTGDAAVGTAGTGDLTALGDTVNAAFRLEQATKELKTDVVLGQVTFDCLRDLVGSGEHFHADEVELKGYEGPVKTWTISFGRLAQFLQQIDQAAKIRKI